MTEKKFHITMRAAEDGDPLEYVMSDESVDRYGDIIQVNGWDLRNFRKNPIALFGHDSKKPIGKWADVRIESGMLKGRLQLAPQGVSSEIDTYRALVAVGVMRAVSVGFIPQDYEIRKTKDGGYEGVTFTKQELVECSLVSVPANPNALQIAKALEIPRDQLTRIFGDPAAGLPLRRAMPGEPADSQTRLPERNRTMSTFAQRIQATQQGLAAKHDRLAQLSGADDSEPAEVDTLAKDIERDETTLASLQRAEAVMARQSVALSGTALIPTPPQNGEQGSSGERRVFAQAKKNLSRRESSDLLIRGLACRVVAKVTGQRPDEVLAERYPDNHQVREVLNYVQRAASAPATTTTTGWAAELVSEAVLDFLDNLVPDSIYPRLRDMGARFTFGRNGIVTLPSRAATPTIAGSFVAQGGAIPVRQAAFNAVSLTPKKMAVISTFTREIAEHSTPNIEALIRQIITEDTSISIDSVLLDATAASTTRPAGLRNGVTVTTASAEAVALDALVEDAKTLLGVLIGANALRMPVWIMNPAQELAIGLISNANGEFPFAGQLEAGRFLRYPILTSTTVTAGQLILVDAADFFSATGDEPRFDVNDSATLHMEDTTPLALSAAGSPNTVAAPIRSLWQTDTIGIRMIMELNWAMRRSGVIAWTETVVW